jgi:hypothetical protein
MVPQLSRFGWACVCLVVWPIYYGGLMVRSLIPGFMLVVARIWSTERLWRNEVGLYEAFMKPPFLDRLRA